MAVNKVILVGHVGKDPELRHFDNGTAVANFSLATTEKGYTAANGTTIPDRTEWHNIVCWRGLAKVAESYIRKGTQIYVEGKIRTRSYDDQHGGKRYVTEIFAENVLLLGKKQDNQEQPSQPRTQQPLTPVQTATTPFEEDIDDLPF